MPLCFTAPAAPGVYLLLPRPPFLHVGHVQCPFCCDLSLLILLFLCLARPHGCVLFPMSFTFTMPCQFAKCFCQGGLQTLSL